MTNQQTESLTFEKVWAMFQETDKKFQETSQLIKELRESRKEVDLMLGKLGNRFGEMIEYMVKPAAQDKFKKFGFVFEKPVLHHELKGENGNVITEIDILLEGTDKVMCVEVKSKPDTMDVKEHVQRMEKIRGYAGMNNDNRKYYGAIAGLVITDDVIKFAAKNGLYIIQPSGEAFEITAPPDNN